MKIIVISVVVVLFLSALYYTFFHHKVAPQKNLIILTFLGAPGSGKGTLAEQCVEKLGMKTLSTGHLCRQAIARQDEQGKLIQDLINNGKLVPDEIISNMALDWLDANATLGQTIILDGYPRTARQAELLTQSLGERFPQAQLHVVSIEISNEAIIKRISSRLVCENRACSGVYNRSMLAEEITTCQKCGSNLVQRDDDKEDVVRQRLEGYARNNDPLVAFYLEKKIPFHTLDVENKSVADVFENFNQLYQSIK
jgi:adenylate kinase